MTECKSHLRFQDISGSADGVDQFGFKISIQLFSQIADIDIHNIGIAVVVVIPDMLLDLFPGKDNALVQDQITEHSKFLAGERDFRIARNTR